MSDRDETTDAVALGFRHLLECAHGVMLSLRELSEKGGIDRSHVERLPVFQLASRTFEQALTLYLGCYQRNDLLLRPDLPDKLARMPGPPFEKWCASVESGRTGLDAI